MFGFVVAICAILGLAVGSFLNVVIWRVPNRDDDREPLAPDDAIEAREHGETDVDVRDLAQSEPADDAVGDSEVTQAEALPRETIFWPSSYCPECQTPLKPYDNIPLVSWLVLRGKCRHCGVRIPVRYPLVELANTVLWILVALVYWNRPELPAYLILASGLLALSVIDLELKLLPTRIVVPLGFLVALGLAGAMVWTGAYDAGLRAVLAGLAAYVLMRLLYEVTRGRGIGYGDVRLSFVLGLALGWLGWGYVIGGIMVGFFLGALVGLLLLAFRLVSRRTPIPFGPFLAAGTMVFILVGAPIIDWYLGT
jgi:leader peptidase (prepilin peptidase)/N-methyltransferase